MNVYDFDNTIYDGESALDFFFEYVKVNPALVKMIPKVLRALSLYAGGRVTIEDAMKKYAPYVKKYYCEYDKWEEFTERFWDKRMDKIKPFYKKIQRGDDVILTASPELTIGEICRRLGIENYICSHIDDETGQITRLCMRENKIKYFYERYPDAEIENFYTDSIKNDGFFAEKAKNVYLVKGDKITKIK